MSIFIRKLNIADAAAYRELRLRALREHPDAFTSSYEEETEKPLAWSKARLGELSNGFFLGAFSEYGVMLGMVGLLGETQYKVRHKATLIGMYVVPEAGGQGLGTQLVQACLEQAAALPGLEMIKLTVTAGNRAAEQLYLNAGFRPFGTEQRAIRVADRYYDKIHMFLTIKR